jgi:phosphoribosylanthranilate isomerase
MIERAVKESGVGVMQLHGDETPEFCESLRGLCVIKAFRGRQDFAPQSVTLYKTEAILFDAYNARGWGGTGVTCDWEMARRVRESAPQMWLAGGLTPDNVAAAVASVEPWGVDVCSGVESAPGRKDVALMRRFVAAARGRVAKS